MEVRHGYLRGARLLHGPRRPHGRGYRQAGGDIQTYWTLGQFDIVAVCDAPNDATASALAFTVGALGNVRTQTLRAISQAEIGTVLSKMA
jgi:uncharacterized protein with GYD domain